MASRLLETNLPALTYAPTDPNSETINMEELEDYLVALELDMKASNEHESKFHGFLDLPAELRGLVYEQIAYETTIKLDAGKWHHWPSICFASHQTYDEALPIVCRCASFAALVNRGDFSQIISVVEHLPPTCLTALSANDDLTIFPGYLNGREQADVYSLLQPWLSLCSRLANNGNSVKWFYKGAVPMLDRGHISHFATKALQISGYHQLQKLYSMLQDESSENEVAGMMHALQSSSRYIWRLAKAEMEGRGP